MSGVDDNAAWKARERDRLLAQTQEQDAAERLYSNKSDAAGDRAYIDDDISNGWRTFGAVSVVIAVLALLIMAMVLFSGGLSRVGGAGVLFTGGNCTCRGLDGRDGRDGRDGQDGTCTNPCVDGSPGPAGNTPMCEFNPMCLTGDILCNCTDGRDGEDGVCLAPCINGTRGDRGPPGFNGTCTQPCINGTNGIDGTNGTDGVCNCFQEDIVIASLTVNNSLTVDGGSIMCPNGGVIDLNCLMVGNCTDFSMCDLRALSLVLQDGIGGSSLQVGVPQATTAGPFQSTAIFGDHTTPNYRLNLFTANANQLRLNGDVFAQLRGRLQTRVESTQGPLFLLSESSALFSTRTGMTLSNTVSGSISITNSGTGSVQINSNNRVTLDATNRATIDSPIIRALDSSVIYWETDPDKSYMINSTTTSEDATKRSVRMAQDLIFEEDKRIISLNMDQTMEIGPNIRVPQGSISSGTSTLTLVNDVALTTGIVQCPVGGCTFNGNVQVNGDIMASGNVSATVGCCTSDPRVKRDIEPLSLEGAQERVMNTPVYSFKYTQEYVDSEGGRAYEGTLRGFMADQVEKNYPYAVRRIHKKVGDHHFEDLMQINLEMMLADLWAAHQELRQEVAALKATIKTNKV